MKIFAIGMNYAEHTTEFNNIMLLSEKAERKTAEPVIFTKADSALLKNGKPLHSDILEKAMDNMDAFMSLARKSLTLEGTVKNLPFAEEWLKDYPEISACQDMYAIFSNLANTYFATKYSVNLNLGSDAEIKKFFFPVELAEVMVGQYEEKYNKYHAMLAGGNA